MRYALSLLGALLVLLTACDDEDLIAREIPRNSQGFVTVESGRSFDATADQIVSALQANPNISIVADVDHAQNAPDTLSLRPTRVILFGNPNLGTPLMQAVQTTGIDLPQKLLIWEDDDGQVFVTYNSPAYLDARHNLSGVDDVLDQIGNALANFATSAAGNEIDSSAFDADDIGTREGLEVEQSSSDFQTTYDRLKDAIASNSALSVIAELDHAANAQSVGLNLRPTRLIVFGNPTLGTQLMQAQQSIGLDLPQKMLVYEDDQGQVFVAYNDPSFLAERHDIEDQDDVLDTIAGALQNLANAATTDEGN